MPYWVTHKRGVRERYQGRSRHSSRRCHLGGLTANLNDGRYYIALSEEILVVGAPGESSSSTTLGAGQSLNDAPGAGAVHVFGRLDNGGTPTWTETAYLKASNAEALDGFGASVSVSSFAGFSPWIVVGAAGEDSGTGLPADNSALNSGAAYLFEGGAPREDSSAAGLGGNQFSNGNTDSGAAYAFRLGDGAFLPYCLNRSTVPSKVRQRSYGAKGAKPMRRTSAAGH